MPSLCFASLSSSTALDKAKYKEHDPTKFEGTPLTLERFEKWKKDFKKEMEKNKPVVEKKGVEKKLTGKELFTVNPDLEGDMDEGDVGVSIYDMIDNKNRKENPEPNDQEENVEIDEDLFDADDLEGLDEELDDLTVNE